MINMSTNEEKDVIKKINEVRTLFDNTPFLSIDEKEDMKIAFMNMYLDKDENNKRNLFINFELKYLTLFAKLDQKLRLITFDTLRENRESA